MRRTSTLTLATLAFTAVAANGHAPAPGSESTPEPRLVNIIAACTSPSPRVAPPSVTVNGADEVQWRDPSGQAEAFTVAPKVPGEWPFAASTHEAVRGQAAATGAPGRTTMGGQPLEQGQVFPYTVTIVCPGAASRVVEGEVVIGQL